MRDSLYLLWGYSFWVLGYLGGALASFPFFCGFLFIFFWFLANFYRFYGSFGHKIPYPSLDFGGFAF
jgi:hypothetical protein